jgi:hypothetical protein
MRIFWVLYFIFLFSFSVVLAILANVLDFCIDLVACCGVYVKKFFKRVYWSVLRCSWRFGKRCR